MKNLRRVLLSWWQVMQSESGRVAWRRRVLGVFILCTLAIAAVVLIVDLARFFAALPAVEFSHLVYDGLAVLLLVGLWYMNRAGHTRPASYLHLGFLVAAFSGLAPVELLDRVIMLCTIPTVMASFLIGPVCSFLFAALSVLGYLVAYLAGGATMGLNYIALPALFILAFIAWVVADQMEQALSGALREVAEPRQVERVLKEPEGQFKTLAEQLPNMVFINKAGRVVYANRKSEELMGYTREEYYSPDFEFLTLIAPEHRGRVMASFRRHLRGEEVEPYEYSLLTKNGERIEAIITTRLIDYEGERAILGIVTDITERVRAEREVRWWAETLAALHEMALDLAAQRALPDLLQAIVARAVRLLGARGGGIYLYRPATDDLELAFTHHLDRELAGTILGRGEGLSGKVLDSGRPLSVADYTTWEGRSGKFRQAALPACVAVPILWGDRPLGVLYLVDDAPRVFSDDDVDRLERLVPLAGAALEQTRLLEEARARWQEAEMLRQAVVAVNEVLSLDERLERILEQLVRVVPCDSASVQLLRDGYLEIVGGRGFADPQAVIGIRLPVPGDNPNTLVVELRAPLILPDARAAHPPFREPPHDHIRSWLGVPLIVQERVIGILALDSVELAHFSEEHVRLVIPFAGQVAVALENARLYDDLRQQMQRLRETQAQLVQSAKLAAVGELAAGVAHELNNPMTSVLGFAEILLEEVGADSPLRQDLETIATEARRARGIVSNLLDFARQARPARQPADVKRVLQQTLAVVRYQLEKGGVVIEEDYAPDLGPVLLDEGQMKQVFLNLVTNAFQAMPAGGILRVGTRLEGDQVVVSVSDTGEGIAPENLPRIFDPFFSTKPEGTGLGLSVSLGIVQQHGGSITVESEPGKGSTLKVWLPVESGEG